MLKLNITSNLLSISFLIVMLPYSYATTISHKHHHHGHKTHPHTASSHRRHLDPLNGEASYYADYFAGRKTASGRRLDMQAFVAAHRSLPLGTKLKVTNLLNDKAVYVEIIDRMPRHSHHVIDLTKAAAEEIGLYSGVTRVHLSVVDDIEVFKQQVAQQKARQNLLLNQSQVVRTQDHLAVTEERISLESVSVESSLHSANIFRQESQESALEYPLVKESKQ